MVLSKEKGSDLKEYILLACGNQPFWDVIQCLDVIGYLMQATIASHEGCVRYAGHNYNNSISLLDYRKIAAALTCPITDLPLYINDKLDTVKAIVFRRLRKGE